jgi:hypothetical protein
MNPKCVQDGKLPNCCCCYCCCCCFCCCWSASVYVCATLPVSGAPVNPISMWQQGSKVNTIM